MCRRPKITRPLPYICINKLSQWWSGKSFTGTTVLERGQINILTFRSPMTSCIVSRDCGIIMLIILIHLTLGKRSKLDCSVRVYTFSCLSYDRKSNTDASYISFVSFSLLSTFLESLLRICQSPTCTCAHDQ